METLGAGAFDGGTVLLVVISTATILGLASMVAVYLGRRTKSSDDWAVGGRNLPLYVIVGTQYSTAMGGGLLVAHVGIGYQSGWSVVTYGLLLCGGLFLIGVGAPWLRRQGFATLPDVFGRLYGPNKLLQGLVSGVCIVVPFGWVCTQLVAFGKLFAGITGISMPVLMVAMAVVALAFVIPAGLTSVAWTDFVFGCLMLTMSLASAVFALKIGGGWQTMLQNVPAENISLPEGLGAIGGASILLWGLAILPGTLTNQMYYQRVYALRAARLARVSLGASAVVLMTAVSWAALVGMAIRSAKSGMAPELAAGWFLSQLPTWFLALYVGFISATIVSTIDSAIQSAVVNMTKDIYKKLINPSVADVTVLRMSRVLSVLFTVAALLFALAWPEALGWLVATYAYSAAALLFPLVLGFLWRDKGLLTPQGAIASAGFGFCGCAVGQILDTPVPYPTWGFAASLFGLLLVSRLTRKSHTRSLARPVTASS
jgi:SSS family solute:Na+ symporter